MLILPPEPLRASPDGPAPGVDWTKDSPLLTDVLARMGKQKFLATKQFTVRGSRTWKGTVPAENSSSPSHQRSVNGEHTVTWQWEATFRMKGAKKKRR